MKNNKIFSLLVVMLALGFSNTSFAQYDDLYYNPADDKITTTEYNTDVTDESFDAAPASDENATYGEDDSFYSPDNAKSETRDRSNSDFRGDDYGYEYSSRIRRFNTPYPGFGFYDPIYVDVAYYDPFYTPGTNIYVFSGYNRYDRFGRNNFAPSSSFYYNSYGSSYYNPYAPYNPYSGYNPYNNGYNNNFYSNNYYGSSYGGGYNPYCPPTGGYGSYGNNNNTNSNNNGYRGSRRSGEGTATGGSTSSRGRGQVDPLKSNDGEKKVNTSATRSSSGDNGGSSRSKYSRGTSSSSSSGSATSGSSSRSSSKATTRSSSSSSKSSGSSSRSSSSKSSSSGSSSKKGRGGK